MFAIRKTEAGAGLSWVGDLPRPEVGPTDVLIAVTHAGICGTDRHIYEWDEWAQGRIHPPLTLGHEFVGVVAEIGSDVTRIALGQRVTGEGHIGCARCRPCLTGNSHVCERVKSTGLDRDGAFAEFIVMPESNVWTVNEAIPDRVAAIMDPLGNAMHTVMSANVTGRTVLVTGAGVIGLMAIAIARNAGASEIVAVDIEQRHLQLATDLGADVAYDAREFDATKIEADVWLEMSGSAQAIDSGFKALANGGTVALLGLPHSPVTLDIANDVIFKGATVLGITGRRMYDTWFQMERFLAVGSKQIESLVSDTFPVDEFDKAFATVASGHAVKVILEFPRNR